VEPGPAAARASAAAGAEGAVWGVGATGRQLSRLAGRARPGGCLMNMVDDATGTTLCRRGRRRRSGGGGGAEGLDGLLRGAPGVVHGLEEWDVREPKAGSGCGRGAGDAVWADVPGAGDRDLAASSPQAKGRVERNHGTHQDRLIKKLRRKGIGTHADANRYLAEAYCRSTTLVMHSRRRRRRTTTYRAPERGSWRRSSGWKPHGAEP